ncbi:uncharacterized protein LOC141821023 [Curcuma longa]|uniref:uncharacterized protein LOC141821023 n=1 Tax=Curcuma longa TaxID=136217 RepID=UPI003D9E3F57
MLFRFGPTETKVEVVPTWAPPETKEEEENVVPTVYPPHDYDAEKYERVVARINAQYSSRNIVDELVEKHRAQIVEEHRAQIVVDKARQVKLPLNLMGDSVLHEVIARRKTDLAVAIIDGLNSNEVDIFRPKNYYGDTPLHIAAAVGDSKVAEALLKKHKELASERNRKGETPLHKAVQSGHLGVLNIIIKLCDRGMAHGRTDDGSTILHYAIIHGRTKEALDIARHFPQLILTRNVQGATPFHIMADFHQKLLNTGRKIIVKERELSNYEMIMELLELLIRGMTREVAKKADVAKDIGWEQSPLITGIKLGIDNFVIKLLQGSPWSALYVDYEGRNVLQAAVEYGRVRVVKAIKEDERMPPLLFTSLEFGTNNTLLHIAASYENRKEAVLEADPLCLQHELQWFEMLENIVPIELLNYRNKEGKTAQEVFDEKHEVMLKNCRRKLAEIGRTCSPLLAAVVFTSSFYIPGEHNRESNRLAFKIFSHVYVVGFSCAATSLVMFLLLTVRTFTQRDFRWKVPWHYKMAWLLLAMSLAAFIVAFACNMYLQIYGEQRKSRADLATLLLELLLIPFLCASALFLTGAFWGFSTLKRFTK